jgi:broad specificity phosphatase PhoE
VSTLFVVRHGQASFMASDYDQLSPVGIEQARALGASWAAHGARFDALYVGPQWRHAQTAEHLRAAASEHGLLLPEPIVLEGSGEIDFHTLFASAFARVEPMRPGLGARVMAAAVTEDDREAMGHVMGMFDKMMERWARGDPPADGLESFEDFSRRINSALVTLMREQGRKKTVALVSSGGPIAQIARLALDLPPAKTIDIMTALYNCGVSELRYTIDRLSLITLNEAQHLAAPLRTRI